ncbi:MAG TPA: hypothetical protein VFV92_09050, partial [Candidatus Bathyarchaeia archaeon]|nr:hypothetical protein [Candidatus Bathyarchaeia archaeon]
MDCYTVVLIVPEAQGTYAEASVGDSHVNIVQARMFVGVILLLVSRMATAQSPSNAQLSPADLVKAVIHKEIESSDVTEIRWKYLLFKEVDGKQETREVVETKS